MEGDWWCYWGSHAEHSPMQLIRKGQRETRCETNNAVCVDDTLHNKQPAPRAFVMKVKASKSSVMAHQQCVCVRVFLELYSISGDKVGCGVDRWLSQQQCGRCLWLSCPRMDWKCQIIDVSSLTCGCEVWIKNETVRLHAVRSRIRPWRGPACFSSMLAHSWLTGSCGS